MEEDMKCPKPHRRPGRRFWLPGLCSSWRSGQRGTAQARHPPASRLQRSASAGSCKNRARESAMPELRTFLCAGLNQLGSRKHEGFWKRKINNGILHHREGVLVDGVLGRQLGLVLSRLH